MDYSSLLAWHLTAFFFHLALVIFAFLYPRHHYHQREGYWAIGTTLFFNETPWQTTYYLGTLLPFIPLTSALSHLSQALLLNKPWLSSRLHHGRNPLRWMEYTVSAGLMFWVIGQLCGITELSLLLELLALNGCLQYCGYRVECSFRDATALPTEDGNTAYEQARTWFHRGLFFYLLCWLPPVSSFAVAQPPDIVYVIFAVQLCLFSSFGLIQTLVLRERYNTYTRIGSDTVLWQEKAYTVLSFLAKGSLILILLIGAGRDPDTD